MKHMFTLLRSSLLIVLVGSPFMVVLAQSISPEEVELKQKAAAYVTGRKLDSALYFSKKLVAQYPGAGNHLLTGSVYELRNDKVNADKSYNKAVEVAGKDLYKVYSDLGLVMLKRMDTVKAIEYEHASLSLNEAQADVHYFLGGLHEVRHAIDSANYHFTQAWRQDSTNTIYLQKMYAIAYAAGDMAAALPYLEKAVAIDGRDEQARNTLVYGYLEIDAFSKALGLLNQKIADTLAGAVDYFNQARCYLNLGDTTNGLSALRQAIAFSVQVNNTYYDELVQVLAAQGQHKQLVTVYEAGAAAGIEAYQAWLRGYQEAVTGMDSIYKGIQGSNAATSLFQLGKLYISIQDYTNSLKVLQDYQAAGGAQHDSLYSLLAISYVSLNKYAQAKESIEKALALAPANEDYKLLLLSILYRLQDFSGVISTIGDIQVLQQKDGRKEEAAMGYLLFKSHWGLGHVREAAAYHKMLF